MTERGPDLSDSIARAGATRTTEDIFEPEQGMPTLAPAVIRATDLTGVRESRLPELFCGFDRDTSPLPVPYPVACSPRGWAAGSLVHFISSTLGVRPDARQGRLELLRPSLPEWLAELRMRNLRVGDAPVDLAFSANDGSISVEVLRRTGDGEVVVRL